MANFTLFCLLFVLPEVIYCFCTFKSTEEYATPCYEELADERGHLMCSDTVTCYSMTNATCDITKPTSDNTFRRTNVRLKAFADELQRTIYFNISIFNVKWKEIRVKLYRNEKPTLDECAAFKLNSTFNRLNSSITIKIPGNYTVLEGKDVYLKYRIDSLTSSNYGEFAFILPKYDSFTNSSLMYREIFTYVDLSKPDMLTLKIQTIGNMGYGVEVLKHKCGIVQEMDYQYLNYEDNVDGEITYTYHSFYSKGYYYFAVAPFSSLCGEICHKSYSPHIYMEVGSALVIGVVCASSIISVLIYAFYMWSGNCMACYQKFILNNPDPESSVKTKNDELLPSTQEKNGAVLDP